MENGALGSSAKRAKIRFSSSSACPLLQARKRVQLSYSVQKEQYKPLPSFDISMVFAKTLCPDRIIQPQPVSDV